MTPEGGLLTRDGVQLAKKLSYAVGAVALSGVALSAADLFVASALSEDAAFALAEAGPTFIRCADVPNLIQDGQLFEEARDTLLKATLLFVGLVVTTVLVHEALRLLTQLRSTKLDGPAVPSQPRSHVGDGEQGGIAPSEWGTPQFERADVLVARSLPRETGDRWAPPGTRLWVENVRTFRHSALRFIVALASCYCAAVFVASYRSMCVVQATRSLTQCILERGDSCELGARPAGTDYYEVADVLLGAVARTAILLTCAAIARSTRFSRRWIAPIAALATLAGVSSIFMTRTMVLLRILRGAYFFLWFLAEVSLVFPALRRTTQRWRARGRARRERPRPLGTPSQARSGSSITSVHLLLRTFPAGAHNLGELSPREIATARASWRLDYLVCTAVFAELFVGVLWSVNISLFRIPSLSSVQGSVMLTLAWLMLYRVWVICQDMDSETLLLERETTARRVRRAQGRILHYVSHDLRMPLQRIVHAITEISTPLAALVGGTKRLHAAQESGESRSRFAEGAAAGGAGRGAGNDRSPVPSSEAKDAAQPPQSLSLSAPPVPRTDIDALLRASSDCVAQIEVLRAGTQEIATRVRDATSAVGLARERPAIPLRRSLFAPVALADQVVLSVRAMAAQRHVRIDIALSGLLRSETSRRLRGEPHGLESVMRSCDPAGCPHVVLCDGDRLLQASTSLVMNAVKFSHVGSSVAVRVSTRLASEGESGVRRQPGSTLGAPTAPGLHTAPRGQSRGALTTVSAASGPRPSAKVILEFQVTDTGRGMTRQALADVLHAPSQSTRGLGLAMARYIVEAHSGHLYGSSPGPGKGCTFGFLVVLPAAHPLDAPAKHVTGPDSLTSQLAAMQKRGEDLAVFVDRALASTCVDGRMETHNGELADTHSVDTFAPHSRSQRGGELRRGGRTPTEASGRSLQLEAPMEQSQTLPPFRLDASSLSRSARDSPTGDEWPSPSTSQTIPKIGDALRAETGLGRLPPVEEAEEREDAPTFARMTPLGRSPAWVSSAMLHAGASSGRDGRQLSSRSLDRATLSESKPLGCVSEAPNVLR